MSRTQNKPKPCLYEVAYIQSPGQAFISCSKHKGHKEEGLYYKPNGFGYLGIVEAISGKQALEEFWDLFNSYCMQDSFWEN